MKIKDMVAYLSKLDQEAEVLIADYYYSDREDFTPESDPETFMSRALVQAKEYNEKYKRTYYDDASYLFDTRYVL